MCSCPLPDFESLGSSLISTKTLAKAALLKMTSALLCILLERHLVRIVEILWNCKGKFSLGGQKQTAFGEVSLHEVRDGKTTREVCHNEESWWGIHCSWTCSQHTDSEHKGSSGNRHPGETSVPASYSNPGTRLYGYKESRESMGRINSHKTFLSVKTFLRCVRNH